MDPIKKLYHGVDTLAEGDLKSRINIKTGDELELIGSAASACDIAELFSANTQARPSKIIMQDDAGGTGAGFSGYSYSQCSVMRGGAGFYLSDGEVIARGAETGAGDSGISANPGRTSYCSEVSAVEMQLRFRENNARQRH